MDEVEAHMTHKEEQMPEFKRVRYFFGQLLGPDDFEDEQRYHMGKRRLHNRHLHGSGTVSGLSVDVGDGALLVEPGLAIDGRGREISVPEAHNVPLPHDPAESRLLVCLCYEEAEDDIAPAVGDERRATRVRETYRIVVHGETDCDDGCVKLASLRIGSDGTIASEGNAVPVPSAAALLAMIDELRLQVEKLEALHNEARRGRPDHIPNPRRGG